MEYIILTIDEEEVAKQDDSDMKNLCRRFESICDLVLEHTNMKSKDVENSLSRCILKKLVPEKKKIGNKFWLVPLLNNVVNLVLSLVYTDILEFILLHLLPKPILLMIWKCKTHHLCSS
jgi:hypothetical protein